MNIEYIKYSDTGLVRQVNQDRIFAVSGKDCGLYVVADGIGGHFCGEIASSKLINAFDCWWKEFSEEKSEFHRCADELKEIILRINSEIYNEFSAKGKLCGTTVALLFICGGKYVIINIGDSRIYTLRGGKLNKETVDHTILAEAKIRGKQPSKDAKDRLTSAVGCQKELKMSIKTASVRASPFFICSDGVYKYVSGRDIVKFMQKRNLDGAERLCNRIIGNGAGDNYSFILVYAHNNAEEGGCNQRKDIINQPNEKKFLRGSTTMKKSTKIIIPIAVAVIIIAAIICVLSIPKSGEATSVTAMLSMAQKYLIDLDYEQAIAEFEKIIELEPRNVDAYLGLAEAYEKSGDIDKAIEILQQGYELTADEQIAAALEVLLGQGEEETETTTTTTPTTTTTVTTTTPTTTTEPPQTYTTEELEEVLLALLENPNADVEQSKLDAIIQISIWGDEFYAVNNSCWTKYSFSWSGTHSNNVFTLGYNDYDEGTDYNWGTISDLSFVKRLKNLTILDIEFNCIRDISVLSGMTNLTCLSLAYNNISDISALSKAIPHKPLKNSKENGII